MLFIKSFYALLLFLTLSSMDMVSTPLMELDTWRKRQKKMYCITEQLKSKDCKSIIGILIAAKSRVLKRWKTVDAG